MGIRDGMDQRASPGASRGLVVPMNRNKDPAWDLPGSDIDAKNRASMRRVHLGKTVLLEADLRRIVWIDLDKGVGQVACEARRKAGSRHRVPLVANPPGVQQKRKVCVRCFGQDGLVDGDETRPARGREEAGVREDSFFSAG